MSKDEALKELKKIELEDEVQETMLDGEEFVQPITVVKTRRTKRS